MIVETKNGHITSDSRMGRPDASERWRLQDSVRANRRGQGPSGRIANGAMAEREEILSSEVR